ncbi:MAG: LutB/LldF family L-lactate oxidation iron-sulfur protein [Pseudomonadota bacterium]
MLTCFSTTSSKDETDEGTPRGGDVTQRGPRSSFRADTARAAADASLREAMRKATDTFIKKRTEGTAQVPFEEWRDQAAAVRTEVLENLPELVDRFAASATKAGAIVHRARDAESARETVAGLLKDRQVKRVVKAKSMVTEEIHLNRLLESNGIRTVETDLGEYIVQIAGETPSHILAPAIHKTKEQIGRLFSEKLGVPYSDDPVVLTGVARKVLREEFLAADAGISGANFAVADTGSIVIFTNEGNGRMVTTLPPIHIAVLTIEKMLPSPTDLASFIKLLPRSATGQGQSSYVSILTGTRKDGERTGAKELHIVLLDNGRSRIRQSELRDILKCIRCSACINVCPVYRTIGGHAYSAVYSGPMGIVLTNALEGINDAYQLADACTLCGACNDVCPAKIPLTKLISLIRRTRCEQGLNDAAERAAMSLYGTAVQWPKIFSLGLGALRAIRPMGALFGGPAALNRLPLPTKDSLTGRKR